MDLGIDQTHPIREPLGQFTQNGCIVADAEQETRKAAAIFSRIDFTEAQSHAKVENPTPTVPDVMHDVSLDDPPTVELASDDFEADAPLFQSVASGRECSEEDNWEEITKLPEHLSQLYEQETSSEKTGETAPQRKLGPQPKGEGRRIWPLSLVGVAVLAFGSYAYLKKWGRSNIADMARHFKAIGRQ